MFTPRASASTSSACWSSRPVRSRTRRSRARSRRSCASMGLLITWRSCYVAPELSSAARLNSIAVPENACIGRRVRPRSLSVADASTSHVRLDRTPRVEADARPRIAESTRPGTASVTSWRKNLAPGSASVRSCHIMTVVSRGIGNGAATLFNGRSWMQRSATRSGMAATQSVCAAAIAAIMKYGTVSTTRRWTRASSHERWATRWPCPGRPSATWTSM